jgi:hypothetical protein
LPRAGDAPPGRIDDEQAVLFSLQKEQNMRPHVFILRLTVLASLVLASALLGGWKWELFPH